MNEIPYEVLAIYGGVAVWAVLAVIGYRKQSFTVTLWFGIALLLYLNVRYLIDGIPNSIAFFVAIYDIEFGIPSIR